MKLMTKKQNKIIMIILILIHTFCCKDSVSSNHTLINTATGHTNNKKSDQKFSQVEKTKTNRR